MIHFPKSFTNTASYLVSGFHMFTILSVKSITSDIVNLNLSN